MSHRRRRLSRVLLAVLGLTIAVGLLTYARKSSSHKASAIAIANGKSANAGDATAGGSPGASPQTKPHVPEPTITSAPEVPLAALAAGVQQTQLSAVTPPANPSPRTDAPAPSSQDNATPAAATSPASASPKSTPPSPAPPGQTATGPAIAPGGDPASILSQAKAKVQAGKLLEARDALAAALAANRFSGDDLAAARQLLSEVNQTVVFSTRRFGDDRWGGTYAVQPGDRLDRIGAKYAVTPSLLMRLNGIDNPRRLRAGATIKVLKGPFHAVVSKSAFRLDLYLGSPAGSDSVYVTSFPVGLGKDDSTPKGTWLVEPQKKIQNPVYYSPRGEGVIDADDPANPLGEYWIGLTGTAGEAVGKQSYGIHGTIEPDSIGKQASMGCVRLRNEDVAVIFDALVEGKSTVVITD